MSVGHKPAVSLTPQDETLFRAFQSNLLSLISHELRTPLMGIFNSLTLLEDKEMSEGLSTEELIKMARQNAQRLQRTLAALLDLANLESGTFHARLREIDLSKLAQSRLATLEASLKDRSLKLERKIEEGKPILGDPQKLARAIDLCFEAIVPRAEQGSTIQLKASGNIFSLIFELQSGLEETWDHAWTHALAGYEGGVTSPTSAFAGVMQSEQAFLTRMEEGLGSELLLIHVIMRLHGAKFVATRDGRKVAIKMTLKELSTESGLRAVLISRAFQVSSELGSVALALIQIPEEASITEFADQIKKSLFRSSDAVYELPETRKVAIVCDDCKAEDAPRMMTRIQKTIGQDLSFGVAHCPSDGLDPAQLYELAEKRLEEALKLWERKS